MAIVNTGFSLIQSEVHFTKTCKIFNFACLLNKGKIKNLAKSKP